MRPIRSVLLASTLVVGLAACMTGQRPTLSDPPIAGATGEATGDAAADAVLSLLERTDRPAFTARYETLLRLGNRASTATVSADTTGRRSVTIGDVRFLTVGSSRTCDLATGRCEDGVQEARTSDLGFTSTLDAATPARRLRVSLSRATGPTVAHTDTIAEQSATCVDVPLGSTTEVYCALDAGVIARWDAPDVQLTLTSFGATVDEALFVGSN